MEILNNMTAIQELYLELDKIDKQQLGSIFSITDFKRMLGNYYLPKEKDQIIKAFDTADNINTGNYQTGEDYYNLTYPSRITE